MMRFLPANLDAVLVELDDLPQTLSLFASLQAEPITGVEELVPAAHTLLVRFHPWQIARETLVERIRARRLDAPVERADTLIEIPVTYDGADLDDVARTLGVSPAEVIRRHTADTWTVAFAGFAPGFAYLSGGDRGLDVPRHATPRTRIPAGAVGLAGAFSCVYPKASPGGWQIIGTTSLSMWDLSRERPALLQPGFRVRFVDAARDTGSGTRTRVSVPDTAASEAASARRHAPDGAGPPALPPGTAALRVHQVGVQALFQDAGRPGQARQGVSASGAIDRTAWRAANRLVGNTADTACIEVAYGVLRFECEGDVVVAFTGAPAPIELVTADGLRSPLPFHEAVALSQDDSVALGVPMVGCRTYVAVRGGFDCAPVLGSRATDTLAHLGPPPIAAGDVLPVHSVTLGAIVGLPEAPPLDLPSAAEVVTLDIVMGPRTDWFTQEAVTLLANQAWTVTPRSDRVGLRLAGERPLERSDPTELPSEGTVLGALQIPPDGQPVLFLADHPLTGGYPVIAAVATHHLDRAGQIPIGARVRFNPIQPFGDS
jgi:KipI family sensor histidine kinase inhibitor